MFDHRYTHSIVINASPDTVWQVLSDLSRLPQWYYPARRVHLPDNSPTAPGKQFLLWIRTAAGVDVRAPGEILAADAPRMLRWRGRSSGIAATATWSLAPQNGHTVLTHEFAGGGWMMLLSVLSGRPPRTAARRLEGLKRVVEAALVGGG